LPGLARRKKEEEEEEEKKRGQERREVSLNAERWEVVERLERDEGRKEDLFEPRVRKQGLLFATVMQP